MSFIILCLECEKLLHTFCLWILTLDINFSLQTSTQKQRIRLRDGYFRIGGKYRYKKNQQILQYIFDWFLSEFRKVKNYGKTPSLYIMQPISLKRKVNRLEFFEVSKEENIKRDPAWKLNATAVFVEFFYWPVLAQRLFAFPFSSQVHFVLILFLQHFTLVYTHTHTHTHMHAHTQYLSLFTKIVTNIAAFVDTLANMLTPIPGVSERNWVHSNMSSTQTTKKPFNWNESPIAQTQQEQMFSTHIQNKKT